MALKKLQQSIWVIFFLSKIATFLQFDKYLHHLSEFPGIRPADLLFSFLLLRSYFGFGDRLVFCTWSILKNGRRISILTSRIVNGNCYSGWEIPPARTFSQRVSEAGLPKSGVQKVFSFCSQSSETFFKFIVRESRRKLIIYFLLRMVLILVSLTILLLISNQSCTLSMYVAVSEWFFDTKFKLDERVLLFDTFSEGGLGKNEDVFDGGRVEFQSCWVCGVELLSSFYHWCTV